MKEKCIIETERKFLIAYPDQDFLLRCQKYEITQTYLTSPDIERRIRKIIHDNQIYYIFTTKKKVAELSRIEKEKEISKEEYDNLLKQIRPDTYSLIKTRYVYQANDLNYEIDIYPFWNDKAILEVELKDKDDVIPEVKELRIIREVSFDKDYRNTYLASLTFLHGQK